MGQRVPRIKTEVSESQMRQAFEEAWMELFNKQPTSQQIALVLAQNALETGNRKSMWNYNIGNITTDGKGSFNYFDDLKTKEQMSKGIWEDKYLKYRAYSNLKDGIKDYLQLLSGKKYGKAWQHILNPNPAAFSKAIKQVGYYTADEDKYTETLNKLYKKFNKVQPLKQDFALSPSLDLTLDRYLKQIAASNKLINLLPSHNFSIAVNSNDLTNSFEFAKILVAALKEELLAKAFIHTNGHMLEVSCTINGDNKTCLGAITQLTDALAQIFEKQTIKIGGIKIESNIKLGQSNLAPIKSAMAEREHKQFLRKFEEKC